MKVFLHRWLDQQPFSIEGVIAMENGKFRFYSSRPSFTCDLANCKFTGNSLHLEDCDVSINPTWIAVRGYLATGNGNYIREFLSFYLTQGEGLLV